MTELDKLTINGNNYTFEDDTARQLIAQTNANFANYYTKTESYSATEVDTLLRTQQQGRFVVVNTLPSPSADTMFKIYLAPSVNPETQNVKDEFVTLENNGTYSWEKIGTTAIDLSGYSTTEEMNAAIATALTSYYTKSEVDEALGGKQNTIDDLANIRSGAQAGSTAVQPSTLSNVVKDIVAESGVYDVSANNDNAKFESLSALLSSANLNTLIPTDIRKGGMSIKFVSNSDHKYVQYRLIADEWSTDTTQWVAAEEGTYIEDPLFYYTKTDATGKILFGIRANGDFFFGKGCPQQVKDYLGTFTASNYANIQEFLGDIDDNTLAELLDEKVDKVEGKSLIDEDVASSQYATNDIEYRQVVIDETGKILEGITDKEKVLNIPIKTPSVSHSAEKSPEWVRVETDNNGKISEGTKKDGTKVIYNLESPTIDKIWDNIHKLQYFHPIHEHGAIVSFIDDDSGQYVPEIWDEIVQRTGIRFGIACVAGFMSGEVPSYGAYVQMSLQDLQRFYNAGNEVYSHSWSHISFRHTSDLDAIEEECWKSRDWLNENGFVRNSDCIVYPTGMNTSDKDEKTTIIRRNYRFGVATTSETVGIIPEPMEPLFITRCNADSNTLDYLKGKVDEAVAEHKLLVVLTHAYELMGLGTTSLSPDKDVNIQRVVDMIEYAQNQGATILPLEEAIHQIYGWNQY